MIITSIEELADECEEIQNFLQFPVDDDPPILVSRGNMLSAYLARTGKMLADAKFHYACKDKKDRATESMLVDWVDRLNNTCGRQLEWCRTLISKNKAEMAFTANPGKEFNR